MIIGGDILLSFCDLYTENIRVPNHSQLKHIGMIDKYTKAYITFDGANNSTTFTDLIGNTITTGGDAKISTTQSKTGFSSGLFDGNDYLTVNNTYSGFNIGLSDFTIEGYFRFTSLSDSQVLCDFRQALGAEIAPALYLNAIGKTMGYAVNGVDVIIGTNIIVINKWYHIAVSRKNGITKLFVDGVQDGSNYTDSNSYINVSSIKLCARFSNNVGLIGYADEYKISNFGRYTENFVPGYLM